MFPVLVSSWFQIRIVQQGQMEKHDMGGFALLAAHSEERGFDMQTDARKSCKWEGDW